MTPRGIAELLAQRIPDAELKLVPGAGHAYPLERPEESLRIFMGWLQARSPIAAGQPRTGLVAQAEPLTRALFSGTQERMYSTITRLPPPE